LLEQSPAADATGGDEDRGCDKSGGEEPPACAVERRELAVEVERRIEEIESGRAKLIPAADSIARARAAIK